MRLTPKIINKRLSRKQSASERLKATGLFMPEWYLDTYPDVAKAGIDPYEHYLEYGEREHRKPNPFFDVGWYRERSKAACKYDGLALEHYAKRGWKNGVNPSNQFSGRLYLEHNSDVKDKGINPLLHYLKTGKAENRLHYPVAFEFENGKQYIREMQLIHESGYFYEDWYKQFYPDLWHADIRPIVHYILHGAGENRKPNPFFDAQWYRNKYYKLMKDDNPLVFFIEQGRKLGHIANPDFSSDVYLDLNPDITIGPEDAYAHYIQKGINQGINFPDSTIENTSKETKSKVNINARLPLAKGLRDMIDLPRNTLAPTSDTFNAADMNIHWIIPDFAPGGGGHMTIFRMVHHLELKGHRVTIWVNDPTLHTTPDDAYETIVKHFQGFKGDVRFIDNSDTEDSFRNASGDAIIATDCWTVWPAMVPTNFKKRFYFVQDFEPSFHPMGANYLAAEQSYREDFNCICASPWLAEMMQEKYDRKASYFWLAADTTLYTPPKRASNRKILRIAVYARYFTARRAVDLAFLALEKLAERGQKFEVHFFGAALPFKEAPFKYIDHGVASPEQLAAIFQKCDVGVVFSATNYSLVPQEMMACKLPILELSGENTHAIFPEDVATFAEPDPRAIADKLELLLSDKEYRTLQAERAVEWVSGFSWSKSADMVEQAIIDGLSEQTEHADIRQKPAQRIKASVVIPTYNAGNILKPVLDAVTTQKAPWDYEILVIDSGSTDGTVDLVKSYENIRFHSIPSNEFNHGGTRNLGVELTTGEFIAFLTHDACPANSHWLFNLVSAIEHYPCAAGAFGKHYAYDDASAFTKRDLNTHFKLMQDQPTCLARNTDIEAYENDLGWRQLLHFYSDNNSCMRRSIWQDIPYRPIKFGEDQLWAHDIIEAGHSKVYASQAIVYHSHDYEPEENYERNKTESAFFKHFFGYELIKDQESLKKTLEDLNAADEKWGLENDLSLEKIQERKALNESRLRGYLDGALMDTSSMFE